MGGLMLVFGYANKESKVIIGSINNMEIVDKSALEFNNLLETCKVVGLIVFTIGGFVMGISLILPSFIFYKQCLYKDDIVDANDEPPITVSI